MAAFSVPKCAAEVEHAFLRLPWFVNLASVGSREASIGSVSIRRSA
jgi:hypothetical protein